MNFWMPLIFAAALLFSTNAMAQTEEVSGQVLEQFLLYDQDESGSVSSKEYLEVIRQRALLRFKSMDKNRNEEVTPEEFEIFWQERKSQFYKLRDK